MSQTEKTVAPLSRAAVEQAITTGAAHLVSRLDEQGRFEYRRYLDGRSSGGRYNVVRHAGAIYALEQYAAWKRGSSDAVSSGPSAEEVDRAVVRGARYLANRHLDAVADLPEVQAVFSLPEEEVDEPRRVAKLGASGLGLVALVAAHRIAPDTIALEDLRQLGNWLLSQQREDGSFFSKYREAGGADRDFVSLYYPGEAILGLVRLHQLDPESHWLQAAVRGVAHLVSSREDRNVLPADHWLMIAAAELLPSLAALPSSSIEITAIREHVWDLAAQMLEEQQAVLVLSSGSGGRDVGLFVPMSEVGGAEIDVSKYLAAGAAGGFVLDGRSTPTATRLEGLIAARRVLLPHDPQRVTSLRQPLDLGIEFLLRCQVAEGPNRGGFVRAVDESPSSASSGRGGEIRIDYVQHAISALIGYLAVAE